MAYTSFTYSGGVVNSVSDYRKRYYRSLYGTETAPGKDSSAIDMMLKEYHAEGTTDERKKQLKHDILMRTYFLFPHYLKHNYSLTAELFNDAVQNMACNTLQAIDLFKPEKGFPFSNYLIGYFRDAAAKTFKSCNVVSMAAIKRNALAANIPASDIEHSVNPYIVRGNDDEDDEYEVPESERFYNDISELNRCESDAKQESQFVLRGAARVRGCTVEFDDSREYSVADGFGEEVDVDEHIHSRELVDWLEEALSEESGVLTPEERYVVLHHYGVFNNAPMVYSEIADERRKSGRGSACSRISQINSSALEKLREFFYWYDLNE